MQGLFQGSLDREIRGFNRPGRNEGNNIKQPDVSLEGPALADDFLIQLVIWRIGR
jgi:hypothetical protein